MNKNALSGCEHIWGKLIMVRGLQVSDKLKRNIMAQKENNPKRGKSNKPQTKAGVDNRKEKAYESGASPENRSRSGER